MLNKRNFIHIPFFDIKLLIYPYKYYISLEKKSYHNLEKKKFLNIHRRPRISSDSPWTVNAFPPKFPSIHYLLILGSLIHIPSVHIRTETIDR